jgi:DNA-binding winged helix-turn-helix (wHTH) protein/class 3 adenylate cyclase
MVYIFGDCKLNTSLHVLHRAGQLVRLRPKVLHVLTYLLEHRDRVVTKRELCEHIWSEQYISDATLESTLRTVRQILGDSGRTKQLIQTIYGSGYRFTAPVEVRSDDEAQATLLPCTSPTIPTPHRVGGDEDGTPAESIATWAPLPAMDAGGQAAPVSRETLHLPSLADTWEGTPQLVTLLRLSLVDAMALSARQGLGAMYSLMRVLYSLAQRAVQRYGGTILYVAGGSFMAMFRGLIVQDDHAQRAVRAALDLHGELDRYRHTAEAAFASELVVRMGLHTGPVILGGGQETRLAPPVVIGGTAILAASYEDVAEPGAILCSAATARFVQDMGHVEAVGSMLEEGQSIPVILYRIHTDAPLLHSVAYLESASGVHA